MGQHDSDIRDFYFKCQVWEVRTSKPRKNLIVKHIDSHKPKERYQADTVLLSDYIRDDFKYLFTMVDHFTKYGWKIPIKDKKAETILKTFKKMYYYSQSSWFTPDWQWKWV